MCVEAGVPDTTILLNAGGFETLRKDFPPKWWFNKLAVCFYKLSYTFLFFAHKGGRKMERCLKFLNKEDYPVDPSTKSCRWIRWIRLLDLEKERNSDWLIQLDTNKSLAHKSIEVTPCKEHHICSSAKSIECWKYTMNRNTTCGRLPKVLKVHHVQCIPYVVVWDVKW